VAAWACIRHLFEATEWIRSWGKGPRVPGIIAGLEADLTQAVDRSCEVVEGFLEVYKDMAQQYHNEE
jgi:hypothetical protein